MVRNTRDKETTHRESASEKQHRLVFSAILVLGTFLRLWQLGQDSLWNDEAGVALVSLSPSLSEMIEAIRSHAMAMPLDYFLTRLMVNLSLDEAVLRLPSAVFGILALIV
jgi:predicted membrane-bound mannosyltransferase